MEIISIQALKKCSLILSNRLSSSVNEHYFKMYWNELNPQKRNVLFHFDGSDVKKGKIKVFEQCKKNVINFIHLFFSSSNIHGFNHLTDGKRHFTEKYVIYKVY